MMASSSAITTRTVTGVPFSRSPGSASLGEEAVEELVLRLLQLLDRGQQAITVASHGIGVLLGLEVLVLGERRLGHERAQPGLFGGFGEESELLVGDAQLGPRLLQPLRDLAQPPLE